jgi:hypothetical protein
MSLCEYIKYGDLSYADLTQGTRYADIARAYDGYFFYTGRPTANTETNIRRGNDMFQGVNKLDRSFYT